MGIHATFAAVYCCLLAGVYGHITMIQPCARTNPWGLDCPALPDGVELDYALRGPVNTVGANNTLPLCHSTIPYPTPAAKWKAGETVTIKFSPDGVSHSGGHCEFGISWDNGKNIVVLKQVLRYCFVGSKPSGTTNELLVTSYDVELPKDLPSSDSATIFFGWTNASGNREYYSTCTDVSISGSTSTSFTGKRMTILNYPGYDTIPEFNGDYDTGIEYYTTKAEYITVTPDGKATSAKNPSGGGGSSAVDEPENDSVSDESPDSNNSQSNSDDLISDSSSSDSSDSLSSDSSESSSSDSSDSSSSESSSESSSSDSSSSESSSESSSSDSSSSESSESSSSDSLSSESSSSDSLSSESSDSSSSESSSSESSESSSSESSSSESSESSSSESSSSESSESSSSESSSSESSESNDSSTDSLIETTFIDDLGHTVVTFIDSMSESSSDGLTETTIIDDDGHTVVTFVDSMSESSSDNLDESGTESELSDLDTETFSESESMSESESESSSESSRFAEPVLPEYEPELVCDASSSLDDSNFYFANIYASYGYLTETIVEDVSPSSSSELDETDELDNLEASSSLSESSSESTGYAMFEFSSSTA